MSRCADPNPPGPWKLCDCPIHDHVASLLGITSTSGRNFAASATRQGHEMNRAITVGVNEPFVAHPPRPRRKTSTSLSYRAIQRQQEQVAKQALIAAKADLDALRREQEHAAEEALEQAERRKSFGEFLTKINTQHEQLCNTNHNADPQCPTCDPQQNADAYHTP